MYIKDPLSSEIKMFAFNKANANNIFAESYFTQFLSRDFSPINWQLLKNLQSHCCVQSIHAFFYFWVKKIGITISRDNSLLIFISNDIARIFYAIRMALEEKWNLLVISNTRRYNAILICVKITITTTVLINTLSA